MTEKQMKTLGWIATFMSVMMYVSYIPQIMNNLAGQKGNFIRLETYFFSIGATLAKSFLRPTSGKLIFSS